MIAQNTSNHHNCTFCNIINGKISSKIHYEDNNFIAFENIKPKSTFHLLLIPKVHLNQNQMKNFKENEIKLVNKMKEIGEKILDNLRLKFQLKPKKRIGFHIPPHISQEHLHLHLLAGEFKWKSFIAHSFIFPHVFISPQNLILLLQMKNNNNNNCNDNYKKNFDDNITNKLLFYVYLMMMIYIFSINIIKIRENSNTLLINKPIKNNNIKKKITNKTINKNVNIKSMILFINSD